MPCRRAAQQAERGVKAANRMQRNWWQMERGCRMKWRRWASARACPARAAGPLRVGGWPGEPRVTSDSSKGSGSPGLLRSERTTHLCVAAEGGLRGWRWCRSSAVGDGWVHPNRMPFALADISNPWSCPHPSGVRAVPRNNKTPDIRNFARSSFKTQNKGKSFLFSHCFFL